MCVVVEIRLLSNLVLEVLCCFSCVVMLVSVVFILVSVLFRDLVVGRLCRVINW